MHAVIIGFGLGFLVALQLGPMSLFLIRSTLRSGWRVGVAIGAGLRVPPGWSTQPVPRCSWWWESRSAV
jgi:hypothetical protein